MRLPDGRLAFETHERERDVCGVVRALRCRCGGRVMLTGALPLLYECLTCQTPMSNLFDPAVVGVPPSILGPASELPR